MHACNRIIYHLIFICMSSVCCVSLGFTCKYTSAVLLSVRKMDIENKEEEEESLLEDAVNTKPCMKRQLGVWSSISIITGSIIGSGVFISSGQVLSQSGSVSLSFLIWSLCGVLVGLAGLCYIELGLLIPESGGEHAYLLAGFGRFPAFLCSWTFFFCTQPAILGVLGKTFAIYTLAPYNVHADYYELALAVLTILTLASLCLTNSISVKLGASLQNFCTLMKIGALMMIICTGFFVLAKGENPLIYLSRGFDQIDGTETTAASVCLAFYAGLWAYAGWNNLNYIVEEVENPKRTLPIAVLSSIFIVTVLYVVVNVSYLTVLSPIQIINSQAVAIDWAKAVFNNAFAPVLMSVFVAVSCLGSANGNLMTMSRFTHAASRSGHLPQVTCLVHARTSIPIPALIINTLIAVVLVLLFDMEELINLLSFALWIFYGGSLTALIVLRFHDKMSDAQRPYKVFLPIAFLCVCMSVFLVIVPLILKPTIQYVYVLVFISMGVVVYIPFVHKEWRIPGLSHINNYATDKLNLVQTEINYCD